MKCDIAHNVPPRAHAPQDRATQPFPSDGQTTARVVAPPAALLALRRQLSFRRAGVSANVAGRSDPVDCCGARWPTGDRARRLLGISRDDAAWLTASMTAWKDDVLATQASSWLKVSLAGWSPRHSGPSR